MTRKRRRGYIFETFIGDHPPLHVHIHERGEEIGRWHIEHQRPLDDFILTRRLRQAPQELGYLIEGDQQDHGDSP